MAWLTRKPVIYDLWADIRLHWILADYFQHKWAALDALKGLTPFASSGAGREPIIKLFPYKVSK